MDDYNDSWSIVTFVSEEPEAQEMGHMFCIRDADVWPELREHLEGWMAGEYRVLSTLFGLYESGEADELSPQLEQEIARADALREASGVPVWDEEAEDGNQGPVKFIYTPGTITPSHADIGAGNSVTFNPPIKTSRFYRIVMP